MWPQGGFTFRKVFDVKIKMTHADIATKKCHGITLSLYQVSFSLLWFEPSSQSKNDNDDKVNNSDNVALNKHPSNASSFYYQ